jgi:hypothetical protein
VTYGVRFLFNLLIEQRCQLRDYSVDDNLINNVEKMVEWELAGKPGVLGNPNLSATLLIIDPT